MILELVRPSLSHAKQSVLKFGMASFSGLMILYVDEENISKKLKCVICLSPAINPRVHRGCNTVFCENCVNDLLSHEEQTNTLCPVCRQECSEESLQPNDLIKKLLDEISVFCCNKSNGCNWADERGSLLAHLDQFCNCCGCENDECEWVGQEKDRDDHMEECEFVEVNCPDDCGMTMERRFLVDHKQECKVCLELERQRQSMDLLSQCDSLNPAEEEMITMMIGGVVMVASRKMLTRYPESLLGVMFAEKERSLKRNGDGVVFIDTCKTSFAHVLTWLHQGIVCPDAGSGEFRLLKVEAAKWQLQELSEELDELSRRAHLKWKKEKSEANVQTKRQPQDRKTSQQQLVEPQAKQEQQPKPTKPEKQERRIKPEQVEGKVKSRPAAVKTGEKQAKQSKPQVKGEATAPVKGLKNTVLSTPKKK